MLILKQARWFVYWSPFLWS